MARGDAGGGFGGHTAWRRGAEPCRRGNPITLERNKTIVPVTIGARTLRLILDTGMEGDGVLVFHASKVDTSVIRCSGTTPSGSITTAVC